METFHVTITGKMPLLLHADNIEWADKMEAWKNNPDNRAKGKAGDDRTPPWRWIGNLTYDDPKGKLALPSEYIMRCLMAGGAQVPTGKGQQTFKSQTQSGIICEELFWPLEADGRIINIQEIEEIRKLKTFAEQAEAVKELGFSLFVKRAKVGNNKHIRVRPRFDTWCTAGDLIVVDDQITQDVLSKILDIAGKAKGLGDWRPGGKTPGPFGTFTATIRKSS